VDDLIDETDLPGEYFVITLNYTEALNRGLDTTGTQASLARIADNDGEFLLVAIYIHI